MLYTWHSVHLTARWIYYGGFAAYSILSVLVIVAAVRASSTVTIGKKMAMGGSMTLTTHANPR